MLSKITIDLAEDNQPVIKIQYTYSEDVRDKLVKRFLESFGGDSSWATFCYHPDLSLDNHLTKEAIVRPLHLLDLEKSAVLMKERFMDFGPVFG